MKSTKKPKCQRQQLYHSRCYFPLKNPTDINKKEVVPKVKLTELSKIIRNNIQYKHLSRRPPNIRLTLE